MAALIRRRSSPHTSSRRSAFQFGWGNSAGPAASRRSKVQWRQRVQAIVILGVFIIGAAIVIAGGWGLYIVATSVKTDRSLLGETPQMSWWQGILQRFRFTATSDDLANTQTVQGLSYDIPLFPGATFALGAITNPETAQSFSESDRQAVYQFLSNNQSIYLLSVDQTFTQAVDFYKEELASRGWQFITEVPPGDIGRLPGAYWTDSANKRGLRIYTLAGDLWYETVTVEEAEQGLASRVGDLQARQIEARSLTGGRVHSRVGWLFNYPSDWEAINAQNAFFGVATVSFKHKQSNTIISLDVASRLYKPVVDIENTDLEKIATDYFKALTAQGQHVFVLTQFAKEPLTINQAKAVRYTFLREGQMTSFLFFIHKERQLVYVMYTINATETELFNYWLNNMKEL